MHPEMVQCMCRQFEVIDLLIRDPGSYHESEYMYRYDLNSENDEIQRKLEVALLDFEKRALELGIPHLPPGNIPLYGSKEKVA